MSKPEDIPQDVWDAADAVLALIVSDRVSIEGDSEVTISGVDLIARAIMAAKAEEREACALAAYTSPHYAFGSGFGDIDERGQLKPGSPYDAGRYDAAAAIRKRGEG